jgi:hypothetical protein
VVSVIQNSQPKHCRYFFSPQTRATCSDPLIILDSFSLIIFGQRYNHEAPSVITLSLLYAEARQERDDMINPYWIEDRDLKKGEVDYISSSEAQFWKDLLEKYLHPIDDNKEEKVCVVHSYHTVGCCTNMQLSRSYCTNITTSSKFLQKRVK